MKAVLKHIVAHTYRPLLVRYLSRTRIYSFNNIRLEIPAGVFHPGFFTSTHLLLQYIEDINLEGKNFLELGAGSGLIAFSAAKRGAHVAATDINPVAISALKKNCNANGINLSVIQSDLFVNLPVVPYDIIAINPPPIIRKIPSPMKNMPGIVVRMANISGNCLDRFKNICMMNPRC